MTQQIEPCPNCGNKCHVVPYKSAYEMQAYVYCDARCGYRGPRAHMDDAKAIALHNRIARAVREAEELRPQYDRIIDESDERERLSQENGRIQAARDALRDLLRRLVADGDYPADDHGCYYCRAKLPRRVDDHEAGCAWADAARHFLPAPEGES